MKNLFVTDLDGTLLGGDISLSRYSADGLNWLISKGVPITYATSRSFYTASKLLKEVAFRLPCITFNGAYVIHGGTGETIRKNLLEPDMLAWILGEADKLGMRPFVFGKTGGEEKLLHGTPDNEAQVRFLEERRKRGDKRLRQGMAVGGLDEIITVTFLYPPETLAELKARTSSSLKDMVSVKMIRDIYNAGYCSLEFSHINANKGDMLGYLGDLMGVSMDAVTVFGDQGNDADMFHVAGRGIAVANAAEELKAMADAVIGSNEQDGVVKYLQQVFGEI